MSQVMGRDTSEIPGSIFDLRIITENLKKGIDIG